jgi:exonuclease VII large subunit
MSGRMVNYRDQEINASGIFVRRDIPLPNQGDEVSVINQETGDVFGGLVTRVDRNRSTYDIKVWMV